MSSPNNNDNGNYTDDANGNNKSQEDADFAILLGKATNDDDRATLQRWRQERTDGFLAMFAELNNGQLIYEYAKFAGKWLARDTAVCHTPPRKASPPSGNGQRPGLLAPYKVPHEAGREEHPTALIENALNRIIEMSNHDGSIRPTEEPAPFVCLIQSTGYGKTRAVLELAKKRKVVYLVCKNEEGGHWTVPSVLTRVFGQLAEPSMTEQAYERKWIKFLKAVQFCADQYATADDLYKAQITTDARLGKFYDELEEKMKGFDSAAKSTNPPSNLKTEKMVDGSHEKNFTVSFGYQSKKMITRESLIVCLDEVTALGKTHKAFRRAAKQEGVLSIFCDTATSICELISATDHSSNVNGGHLGEFSPPIYALPNIDLEWKVDSPDDDLVNLFSAGRPRWRSFFEVKLRELDDDRVSALKEMIDLAHKLLTRHEKIEDQSNLLISNKRTTPVDVINVSFFTCRYSLGTFSKLSSSLAKYSLATITHVSDKRDLVGSNYPSEPILAEASARHTRDQNNLDAVLFQVMTSFYSEPKLLEAPRGDLGEMCAAALLGFAMDSIRMDPTNKRMNCETMSDAVPLSKLLSVLDCWPPDDCPLTSVMEQWDVNFTHFIRTNWKPTEADLLFMWKRRMAYYVPAGLSGLDLLVAIKRRENEHDPNKPSTYGTLRIQVKNYSAKIPTGERNNILGKLWPTACHPKIQDETFSVGLLLSVGPVEKCVEVYKYNNCTRHTRLWHETTRHGRPGKVSAECTEKRLVLQLATTFPDEASLVERKITGPVAWALPWLLNICQKQPENRNPVDHDLDLFHRSILARHAAPGEKKRKSDKE